MCYALHCHISNDDYCSIRFSAALRAHGRLRRDNRTHGTGMGDRGVRNERLFLHLVSIGLSVVGCNHGELLKRTKRYAPYPKS